MPGDSGDAGPAIGCLLRWPNDVTVTPTGELLVVDRANHRIRRITSEGIVEAFIGSGNVGDGVSGAGPTIDLNSPTEIRIGLEGNYYVAGYYNWRIKAFDAASLECSVTAGIGVRGFSGDGGLATMARLDLPSSLVFDPQGNMYIVDQGNSRIRMVNSQTGIISLFVGGTRGFADGIGEAAQFSFPGCEGSWCGRPAIDISPNGEDLYLTDTDNHTIRKINIATRMVTTIAGTPQEPGWEGDGGLAISSKLAQPTDLDEADNGDIYVADSGNNVIRKISASGIITTVAGNGIWGASPSGARAVDAMLSGPEGLAFDDSTNTLYICDTYNHQIKKVINP